MANDLPRAFCLPPFGTPRDKLQKYVGYPTIVTTLLSGLFPLACPLLSFQLGLGTEAPRGEEPTERRNRHDPHGRHDDRRAAARSRRLPAARAGEDQQAALETYRAAVGMMVKLSAK
jgi:hypothetical protein